MPKRCFVIMPFSATTDKHTENYWSSYFANFIKPAMERFGYSCRRSSAQPSNIIKDILNELLDVDLVVAVLTDFNANVWYELGIRHAYRCGTIMIIEDGQQLPFDISQYGVIKYEDTISGASNFEQELRAFVERIEECQPVDSPAIEFVGAPTKSEYRQRVQDVEKLYATKLERIVELLQGLAKDRLKPEEPRKERPKLQRRRVLWVDDHPENNQALIDLYTELGVHFEIALSTAHALYILASYEYDLVISDMGRGDEADAGVRMIREINRQFGIRPPILIFSSTEATARFGKSAEKEGALLVTDSARALLLKMSEVLGL